ncbi:MAG: MotA/TolQ/ExbB proton channel family protein [Puniceicoccales bacterium]|nr:MotA/TolQ/ExbB proton channel family protein [Puniceicoccales bacterium]
MSAPQHEFTLISFSNPFLWPLLLLSLVALAFFVERVYFLHRWQVHAEDFLRGIKNALRQNHLAEALTNCAETVGPVARVVNSILLCSGDGEGRMRLKAEEAASLELPTLELRIGLIAAIAKIAPLLGLIGTLVGLMKAFLTMQGQGHYATADAFAGDVATTLGTTVLALSVAAIAHLEHHFLAGRVRSILHDIELTASQLIQFIAYELNQNAQLPEESREAVPSAQTPTNSHCVLKN